MRDRFLFLLFVFFSSYSFRLVDCCCYFLHCGFVYYYLFSWRAYYFHFWMLFNPHQFKILFGWIFVLQLGSMCSLFAFHNCFKLNQCKRDWTEWTTTTKNSFTKYTQFLWHTSFVLSFNFDAGHLLFSKFDAS